MGVPPNLSFGLRAFLVRIVANAVRLPATAGGDVASDRCAHRSRQGSRMWQACVARSYEAPRRFVDTRPRPSHEGARKIEAIL